MDRFCSILSLLFVSLTLVLHAGFFTTSPDNEMSVAALSMDGPIPLLYDEDASKQTKIATYDQGTGKITPLSSTISYIYSGSSGISVQQNVTQRNVCSSNTVYCYNEVDNDFNVNPP